MGRARYLVDAVVVGGQSPNQLARSHPISRSWLFELLRRFREGGYPAIEPRSRRPHACSHQVGPEAQAAILALRRELTAAGDDAGAQSIAHHLAGRLEPVPSLTTIWRILQRHGLITPQPHKRPRSSFIRFEAQLPNEMWQCDSTPWQLADGSPVEILNLLDDHSRLLLNSAGYPTVKALDVVQAFTTAAHSYGLPASFLSDNAAVFSGRSRRGKVPIELELERLGIEIKHSTPYHPQTCGKVERFHQTLKRYLQRQTPARSLAHLQLQLDSFRLYYNQQRPHRSVDGRTPFQAFQARLKAGPALPTPPLHYRVRRDRLDGGGKVTIRYLGRLRHVYVSYKHKRRAVTLLVAGPHLRVIADDGSILRELTLDPTRDYQVATPLSGSTIS
jgi:transposase InsO family protein